MTIKSESNKLSHIFLVTLKTLLFAHFFYDAFNPNRCGIFGLLIMQGGGDPATEEQSTAEAKIFNLHQQSAFHMKGVMFSVHLIPW